MDARENIEIIGAEFSQNIHDVLLMIDDELATSFDKNYDNLEKLCQIIEKYNGEIDHNAAIKPLSLNFQKLSEFNKIRTTLERNLEKFLTKIDEIQRIYDKLLASSQMNPTIIKRIDEKLERQIIAEKCQDLEENEGNPKKFTKKLNKNIKNLEEKYVKNPAIKHKKPKQKSKLTNLKRLNATIPTEKGASIVETPLKDNNSRSYVEMVLSENDKVWQSLLQSQKSKINNLVNYLIGNKPDRPQNMLVMPVQVNYHAVDNYEKLRLKLMQQKEILANVREKLKLRNRTNHKDLEQTIEDVEARIIAALSQPYSNESLANFDQIERDIVRVVKLIEDDNSRKSTKALFVDFKRNIVYSYQQCQVENVATILHETRYNNPNRDQSILRIFYVVFFVILFVSLNLNYI